MTTKTTKTQTSKKVTKADTKAEAKVEPKSEDKVEVPESTDSKKVKKAVEKKKTETKVEKKAEKKAEKKVEKKTEKKAEKKVVKKTEKKADKSEGDEEPKEKKERKRREISKETVDGAFKDILERLNEEIETLRKSEEKNKGVKFLRSLNKNLKILHKDYQRVLKLKKRRSSATGTLSGFMKPVGIVQKLADFAGWDVNEKYSRNDTTKVICKYIKDNDLQNPVDRRQIFPDEKLSHLLNFDAESSPDPLTYFRIQKLVQHCFVKEAKKEVKKGDTKVATKKVVTKNAEKVEEKGEEKKVAKKAEKAKKSK